VATYHFGAFEFDARTGELRRDGRRLRLEPQPARALDLLLAHAGELVTRDELRRHLWGDDTHVDFDRGLTYAIAQIRSALGDTADDARFLQTLPRRGFRFVAPIRRVPAEAVASSAPPAPPSPRVRTSRWVWPSIALLVVAVAGVYGFSALRSDAAPAIRLAVSTFDNETGDARYDRFVGSLSDAVVARLVAAGDTRRLTVIGNEAILRRPREERNLAAIQAGTGAEYVVLGQLQPDPGGLRVIAHLIKLDDGAHVWAKRFIRAPEDLASVDGEVLDAVERAVREFLLPPSQANPPRGGT